MVLKIAALKWNRVPVLLMRSVLSAAVLYIFTSSEKLYIRSAFTIHPKGFFPSAEI